MGVGETSLTANPRPLLPSTRAQYITLMTWSWPSCVLYYTVRFGCTITINIRHKHVLQVRAKLLAYYVCTLTVRFNGFMMSAGCWRWQSWKRLQDFGGRGVRTWRAAWVRSVPRTVQDLRRRRQCLWTRTGNVWCDWDDGPSDRAVHLRAHGRRARRRSTWAATRSGMSVIAPPPPAVAARVHARVTRTIR